MTGKCQCMKVEWVLIVEAATVPESWRDPEGWRTLKDYVRDNIDKGGQPGKVKISHGKAYIPMLDPIDACMGFNALVGIWWDGWQLTVTLSEHRGGLPTVVTGPSNERFGQQIRIESIHYRRQQEPATLRRPRNISSTKNSGLQTKACPDPEYITVIGPSALSPYGLVEKYFRIEPGLCPDWCLATISCHSTASLTSYQIPSVSITASPNVYIEENRWSAVSPGISNLFCQSPTSSSSFEDSSGSSKGHCRFESFSSNETTLSTRNGPVIAKSS